MRLFLLIFALVCTGSAGAAELQVMHISPGSIAVVAKTVPIVVTFDRAVDTASVDAASLRVFGQQSGVVTGTFSFADGDKVVIFQPSQPFMAGETVHVTLSHDLLASDAMPLRSAGYASQFGIAVRRSPGTFVEIDQLSTESGSTTRTYGANAIDLDEDGFADLATVNEDSGDVRVFLNLADGSGKFASFLTPQSIGAEASPNQSADFDGDGHADLCIAATTSNDVWVLLGAGDGTFSSIQSIPAGSGPHGIAVLDVDGDGDHDIVNANYGSNDLTLMLNDGNGVFGAATAFEGGVDGEYGLASADIDKDGITDLVVAGRDGNEIRTLLGNGNGTFTPVGASGTPSGGFTWVVGLADLNGDGKLDASTANSLSSNGAILFGNGDGTFGAPTTYAVGTVVVSADLADIDGDGDVDWVLSSFGGGIWRIFRNDGSGTMIFDSDIAGPSNPSCAVFYDADNDGDLDMTLTDEIANVLVFMENAASTEVPVLPGQAAFLLGCLLLGTAIVRVRKGE